MVGKNIEFSSDRLSDGSPMASFEDAMGLWGFITTDVGSPDPVPVIKFGSGPGGDALSLDQEQVASILPFLHNFVRTGRLEASSSWRLLDIAEIAKALRAELPEAHLAIAQEEGPENVELAERMRPLQAEAAGQAGRKIERSSINWTPEQFREAGIDPEGAERAINLLVQLMAVLKENSFLVDINTGSATIIHSPTETAVGWVESELIR